MINFFFEDNYREIVGHHIDHHKNGSRGQIQSIAKHIGVNPTLVSQVQSGRRDYSEEQAIGIADYFGFSENQSYYFLLLVQKERAGHHLLKSLIQKQLTKVQAQARELKLKVEARERELTYEEQAIFYSHWGYSAVRNLIAIKDYTDVSQIALALGLDIQFTEGVLIWLVKADLAKVDGQIYKPTKLSTFTEKDSLLTVRHHQNWRQFSTTKVTNQQSSDFFFTAPLTISKKDKEKFRQQIISLIENLYSTVKETESEELMCFNVDFFKVDI